RRIRRPLTAAVTVGGLALAFTAGLWVRSSFNRNQDKPVVRLDVDLGAEVPPAGGGPILSPDGMRIAYVSAGRIFTRPLDELEPRGLDTQAAFSPFFSPDSQWIGFFGQGKLRKVSVNGGAPIDICPASGYYSGAAWGGDNFIIAALSAAGP